MAEPQAGEQASWIRDFALLWVSRFGIFFAFRQMQPVFPVYLATLGASAAMIGFVMSSFTVTATLSRPFVGLLLDRSGRKPFLLLGIGLFAVAALGYAWAPTIMLMVTFRLIHGLGWSACTTAASTFAADIGPAHRRGAMIAYAGLASNLGAALGPIAGFAAYERFGFHGMFLTVLGVVVLSFLFAVPLHEPHIPTAHEGRGSSTWWEVLVVRESLLPSVIMAFIAFAHAGLSTFIPLYVLQEKLGNPALYFAVEAAFVLISRPIAGPLSDRWSRRAMILPGYALTLLGVVIVALAPSPSVLLIAAAIYGLGLGSAHPALMTLAVDRVPAGRRGLSMAQFQTFHDLGIAVGAVALGALLDLLDNNYSLMYLAAAAVGGSGLALYAVWGKEAAQDRAHSS